MIKAIFTGLLYRLGGIDNAISQIRDVGIPLFLVILCFAKFIWWKHILFLALLWCMLSTYHDTKFYNWLKPKDNFYLHGFFIGICFLVYKFSITIFLFSIMLGAIFGLINFLTNKYAIPFRDWIEEISRGILIYLFFILLII